MSVPEPGERHRKRTFFKKTTRMDDFGQISRFSTTRMGTRMAGKTTRMEDGRSDYGLNGADIAEIAHE
jgi:hypothetical protein